MPSAKRVKKKQTQTHSLLHEKYTGKDGYYYYIGASHPSPNEIWFMKGGDSFNDPNENVPVKAERDFYRCLSYFKSESVAMWKIYAENGCCMKLTPALIEKIENDIDAIVFVDADNYEHVETIPVDKGFRKKLGLMFQREYVYYFSEDEKKKRRDCYYVKRSTHSARLKENEFKEFKKRKYLKSLCWDYECEARLCLSYEVLKELYPAYSDSIQIKVKLKPKNGAKIVYYKSPLAKPETKYSEDVAWEESKLKNHVRL